MPRGNKTSDRGYENVERRRAKQRPINANQLGIGQLPSNTVSPTPPSITRPTPSTKNPSQPETKNLHRPLDGKVRKPQGPARPSSSVHQTSDSWLAQMSSQLSIPDDWAPGKERVMKQDLCIRQWNLAIDAEPVVTHHSWNCSKSFISEAAVQKYGLKKLPYTPGLHWSIRTDFGIVEPTHFVQLGVEAPWLLDGDLGKCNVSVVPDNLLESYEIEFVAGKRILQRLENKGHRQEGSESRRRSGHLQADSLHRSAHSNSVSGIPSCNSTNDAAAASTTLTSFSSMPKQMLPGEYDCDQISQDGGQGKEKLATEPYNPQMLTTNYLSDSLMFSSHLATEGSVATQREMSSIASPTFSHHAVDYSSPFMGSQSSQPWDTQIGASGYQSQSQPLPEYVHSETSPNPANHNFMTGGPSTSQQSITNWSHTQHQSAPAHTEPQTSTAPVPVITVCKSSPDAQPAATYLAFFADFGTNQDMGSDPDIGMVPEMEKNGNDPEMGMDPAFFSGSS